MPDYQVHIGPHMVDRVSAADHDQAIDEAIATLGLPEVDNQRDYREVYPGHRICTVRLPESARGERAASRNDAHAPTEEVTDAEALMGKQAHMRWQATEATAPAPAPSPAPAEVSDEQIKQACEEIADNPQYVKDLAAAHWGYVESVLIAHGEDPRVIMRCGHHYRTAFEHGYKHAQEDLSGE